MARLSVPANSGLENAPAELEWLTVASWSTELNKGTAAPIVELRQSSSCLSTYAGSETAFAFALASEASAAVLLYPSSVSTTLLARKYWIAPSGRGSDVALPYGVGDVDELLANLPEQLAVMEPMRATTVLLSAMMWKVEFDEGELNAACISGPPVRFVFFGSPYCRKPELESVSHSMPFNVAVGKGASEVRETYVLRERSAGNVGHIRSRPRRRAGIRRGSCGQ